MYTEIFVGEAALYNDELAMTSGNGTNFTFSLDVASRHNNAIWLGVTFNYQDANNFYAIRYKGTTASYQLLARVDGAWSSVGAGVAPEVFLSDVLYTISVESSTPYEFTYSITRTSDGTLFGDGTYNPSDHFDGGYAGFFQTSTGGADAKFDNFSLEVGPDGGYALWADGWGVDIGAEAADFDEDGLSNVYEYGLGGNPTNALDQGISPDFAIVNDGGTDVFR